MTTSSASLPHATKRRQILTSDRIRGYGSMIIIVNAFALALTFITPVNKPTVFGGRFAGDFVCFYIAGERVKDGLPLYDLEAQDRTFHELQPNAGDLSLPYVYAPFFSVIFVPLAFLPLKMAFAIWTLISLALYIAGFHFAWEASGLPSGHKRTGLIAALAFLPFSISMLGLGQVVSFGFFALGLSLYLESKEKPALSGMALSLLLFKPTLLILIIPMLFVTRRFRVATGLLIGGTALGLLNLSAVGLGGMLEYVHALSTFGRSMTSSPLGINLSALVVFFAGRPVPLLQYGITLALFLVLITVWIRRSPASWALAITFTPFLSPYAQIYDSVYLALGAILTAGIVYPSGRFRLVLCALFVAPAPALFLIGPPGLPLVSLAMLILGFYQLTLSRNTEATDRQLPLR